MRGVSLCPAAREGAGTDGEAYAHIGIFEGEDGGFRRFRPRDNELEVSIHILTDSKKG